MKGGRNKDQLVDIINEFKDIEFGKIKVDRIILKKSVLTPTGPIYSDIEIIKLEG